jgi:hypothetical protein
VHKELATKPTLEEAWPLVTFHQQILFSLSFTHSSVSTFEISAPERYKYKLQSATVSV